MLAESKEIHNILFLRDYLKVEALFGDGLWFVVQFSYKV